MMMIMCLDRLRSSVVGNSCLVLAVWRHLVVSVHSLVRLTGQLIVHSLTSLTGQLIVPVHGLCHWHRELVTSLTGSSSLDSGDGLTHGHHLDRLDILDTRVTDITRTLDRVGGH